MPSAGFWGGLLGGLSQSLQTSQQLSLEKQELALRRKQLDKSQRTEDAKFAANMAMAIPQFQELIDTAVNTGDTESANRLRQSLESMMQLSQQMLEASSAETRGLPSGFKPDKSSPRPSTKPMTLSTGPGAAKPESSPTAGAPLAETPSDQAAPSTGPTTPLPNRKLLRPDLTEQIAKGSGAAKITRDETGRVTELLFETPEQREAFQQSLDDQEQSLKAKSGITLRDMLSEGVSKQNLQKLSAMKVYEGLSTIQQRLPQGVGVVPVQGGDGNTRLSIVGQAQQPVLDAEGEPTDKQQLVQVDPLSAMMTDGKVDPAKLGQLFGTLGDAKAAMPPEQQSEFEKMIRQDAELLGMNALRALVAEGVIKKKKGGGYDLNPFDLDAAERGDKENYGPRKADYIGAFEAMSHVLGHDFEGLSATALQEAPVRLMEALDKMKAGQVDRETIGAEKLRNPRGMNVQIKEHTSRNLLGQVTDLARSYAHGDPLYPGGPVTVQPGTESTAVTNMLMFMADQADEIGLADFLEGAKRTLRFLPKEDRKIAAQRIDQKLNMIGVYDGDLTQMLLAGD